ncbi:6-phosphofructokinase [Synergistaceae bacterium OttesenSCG-928-I11]|nr:6-phosphofructokinase [Synergistaceae bacterium OttesenSCG-928-I11]
MKRIGVLTSGGDAPGMNAAIRSVTRAAIYNNLDVIGFRRGYEGLLEGDGIPLTVSSVGGIIHRGGTILRTARCDRFTTPEGVREGFQRLKAYDIDALVVIGGDGSFRGAYELHKLGFPVVGIPGTIDNDMAGTDCTIGFDTACNTALQCIQKLRDTASSHERLFIVEVMGRAAGFLALEAAVAAGAECVLVPEQPFDIEQLCKKLHYAKERGKTHSLIIVAEGVMPASELAHKLKDTASYDARIIVLGHIQRGGSPSSFDAVLASRLGGGAIEALLRGEYGTMVGRTSGKIVTNPIQVAWEEKKGLDADMMTLVDILGI